MLIFNDVGLTKTIPAEKIIIRSTRENPLGNAQLDGFAREEKLQDWSGWTRVDIKADKYLVRNNKGDRSKAYPYSVPRGQIIKGLLLETDRGPIVKIISRSARRYERLVNERFPLLGKEL